MLSIQVVDDFLSAEDLKSCIEYACKGAANRIVLDQDFADSIWSKYSRKLLKINQEWVGLYSDITLSNLKTPIKKHIDQKRNSAEHKLLIYLNDVKNGGTIFYEDEKEHLVDNKANRLICFDIRLPHRGQAFTGSRKIAIGFRPRISK